MRILDITPLLSMQFVPVQFKPELMHSPLSRCWHLLKQYEVDEGQLFCHLPS